MKSDLWQVGIDYLQHKNQIFVVGRDFDRDLMDMVCNREKGLDHRWVCLGVGNIEIDGEYVDLWRR